MAGRINKLTPFTQTVAANQGNKTVRESMVRDWDARAGIEQAMVRVDKRTAQGQKKTPIGAGTLRCTR